MKQIFLTKRRIGKGSAALAVGLGLATLCGVATPSPQIAFSQEVETEARDRPEPPEISPEEAEKIRKEIDKFSTLRYEAMKNHEYETAIRAGE